MPSVADSTTLYTRDFRVGDWWARPALNRLEMDAERFQLEPKSMEVLVDLAENAGEIRSKRRLLHSVWKDAFVSDDVLTHAIWELRKAFGDDPKAPEYIRTVPRKGYMLVAEVVWPGADEPSDKVFPYRLGEKLGAGAMGEVYKAEDARLRRTVALKFLPKELAADQAVKDRFLREARAAAALDHAHIGVVHDIGESPDGRMYMAIAYYTGGSLKDRLAQGPLPVQEAIELARQIADGLAAAHAEGIVHRDIKPANVMLTEQGQARIVDFGLARGAGDTTLTTLGSTVGTALYMSPEQARGDEVDPRSDIWSLGVTLYEMLSGERPFRGGDIQAVLYAVLNEEAPSLSSIARDLSPGLEDVVHGCLQKDAAERYQEASVLAEDLATILAGRRPLVGVSGEVSPYPGLAPFSEDRAAFFFGRDQEVEALWTKIRERKLLALIGPSGAGKTSFVRAGLIPARPDGWRCLVAKPGSAPFIALGQALAPKLTGDPESLPELLRFHQPETATAMLSRWRRRFEEALLVVDQFEELFTLNPPEVQAAFAALLGRLAGDADLHVLLSLRDDFLIHCHEHPPLAPVFDALLTPLTALRGSALRQAVTEPAASLGYAFEDDALVDEMVAEVEEEHGALPLVAFTAQRLWEERDREGSLLSRAAYEEMGGVAGALAQHADHTLERVGSERLPVVREIFRNLVTAQGTRAAWDREELLSVFTDRGARSAGAEDLPPASPREPVGNRAVAGYRAPDSPDDRRPQGSTPEAREAAAEVLDQLIDARLLTSFEVPPAEGEEAGHHRIEIIHESLLSHWPRLVRWQTQDQEGAQLRDELRQAAQMWEQHGRSDDLLWTGTAFQEFQIWRQRYPGGLSELEESFADAMVAHAERRKRRRRWAVAAVFILLLVVLGIVGVSRQQAVAEARRAEASKLLALAQLQREEDPTEALAYTTASLDLDDTDKARILARELLWEAPPALEADPGGTLHVTAMFSPDGSRLALSGNSSEIMVLSAVGGPVAILQEHPAGGSRASWASNELLVTTRKSEGPNTWWYSAEGRFRVWSFPGGRLVREIELGVPAFWQPGGGFLAAGVEEIDPESGHEILRLRRWSLPDGEAEELGRVDATALGATDGDFAHGGRGWFYLKDNEIFYRPLPMREGVADRFLGRHDNTAAMVRWSREEPRRLWTRDIVTSELRLWDPSSPGPGQLRGVTQPDWLEEGVRPSPERRWAGADVWEEQWRHVPLWDLEGWPDARPLRLRRSGSWTAAHDYFDPGGDWLAAITHNMTRLTFWPLSRTWPRVVDGYAAYSRFLCSSPDSRWLTTSWTTETDVLRLWPLPGNESREVESLSSAPKQVQMSCAFDPHNRFLFTVGIGLPLIVPLDGSPPVRLEGPATHSAFFAPAISPSGRRVATAFGCRWGSKTLWLWDLETGKHRAFDLPESSSSTSTGCEGGIVDLEFVDESTLYSAGDGGVRRWDLESGVHELVLETPDARAYMSITADGRTALVQDRQSQLGNLGIPTIVDLVTGATQTLPAFAGTLLEKTASISIDSTGTVVAVGDGEGIIRVGRPSADEPYLLIGHEGAINQVAISPDGRWIASTGEDNTLRLWPMPDLDKPPLHTLPRDELLAKLRSLTNIRVVRDPEAADGWAVTLDPFPGWQEVPTW